MARPHRFVIPGRPHHVTQRGTRRGPTFFSDADYELYLELLAERAPQAGVEVWAYCLMPNHVHLVLVPKGERGLELLLGPLHSTYARFVNREREWTGHLWQERFRSFAMSDAHLHNTIRYVAQNPVRAGLVGDVLEWPHASTRALLGAGIDAVVAVDHVGPLRSDWPDYLRAPLSDDVITRIRRASRKGQPMGLPMPEPSANPGAGDGQAASRELGAA